MTDAGITGAMSPARTKEAVREKATAAGQAVADLASEAKGYASERMGEMRERTMARAKDIDARVRKFIDEKPYAAIGIAAGVGFALGLLLKRR